MPSFQFSPSVKRTIAALVPMLCPPDVVELGLVEAVADQVERGLAAMPSYLRHGLAAGIRTYDLGAIVWPRTFGRRASRLTPEQQGAYFDSWAHGPTPLHRQFAKGIKQLIGMACYDLPAMQERVGYRPARWIDDVKKKRLTVFKAAIDKQAIDVLAPDPLPSLAELAARLAVRA